MFGVGSEKEEIEAFYTASAYCMSILMCQEFDFVREKRKLFEEAVNPQKIVQNLVLIISNPQSTQFTSKIVVSVLKVMHRMSVLSSHPDFDY